MTSQASALKLSSRMQQVSTSMTVAIAQRARVLQQQGRKIINMASGELDFDTPAAICAGAVEAIHAGATRYTNVAGLPALKEAVCRKLLTDNKLTYQPGEVIVGTGAKQLIFNAFLATIDPGDEVLIPAPYWVSYPDMVKIAGGTPVIVPATSNTDFKLTAESLKQHINGNTRWLILNSPGNPSGAVYSREEYQALAKALQQWPQVLILSDEIYEYLCWDREFISFAEAVPELFARTLTLNGVSKSYAMTGWRIGYAAGPQSLIDAMTTLQGQSTSNPSSVSQMAALTALNGDRDFLPQWCEILRHRREGAVARLQRSSCLHIAAPAGAFYLFVDCQKALNRATADGQQLQSDLQLASYLLEHAGVATVPGSAFGLPGHLRLTFSLADQDVFTACENIVSVLETLQ
ncbi:pyridoxal phosphate-dependent aminotransferase [Pantoea sp. BAV 3049]|uniref:pyridoxal phosphate-dependent aminotransferase n=1 Tax=Pantoea sp. BAV 3049 TaxID=2654188 RepID=UPI00131AAA01|nr:pyridoxal phosphate-dependent aminotransferase [Pantoea sp. BAV 3049]